ncbi:MAG: dipeptidase PepE [Bacteroidia bacterium]|nr:dipeptidase PepE [Bacteroidia bacterium]
MQKSLLLVSSSRTHGDTYLSHALPQVRELLVGVQTLVFVPFARPGGLTWDEYTEVPRSVFAELGIQVKGIHQFDNIPQGAAEAEAIFIGGGNTFLLLQDLYATGAFPVIQERVLQGMPYMGTSAGSNVAGLTISTTNDMPIVYPPTFEAFGFVNFNLNPHFIPGKLLPEHKGETREDRIHEFHHLPRNTQPVLGIREDSMLSLQKGKLDLIGQSPAVLFRQGRPDLEIEPGVDLSKLL